MKNQAHAFIHDGYNEDIFIKGVDGIYEAVEMSFRPMLPGVVRNLIKDFSQKTANAQSEIIKEAVSRYVQEWSIVDSGGNPVPITKESVAHIKKPLQDRIFDILCGYDGGDKKPVAEGTEEKSDFNPDQYFDEIEAGDEPSDQKETAAEKLLQQSKN